MITRSYISNEPVLNFWSNSKNFHSLSNFTFIEEGIEYEGLLYPSIEHAFQAQKYIHSHRSRFSIHGDLGSWSGLNLVFSPNDYSKKYQFWSKKNNIGVIAKRATQKKIGIQLGLEIDPDFQRNDELWITLLKKKFSIKKYHDLLKSTNDLYLLEFDKGARKNGSFWGGIIHFNILHGENKMGNYLMMIRDSLNP